MIVLTRVIAGVNYSSYYHYEAFTDEVKTKMLEMRLEPGVDRINALENNVLIAYTSRTMDYVRGFNYEV